MFHTPWFLFLVFFLLVKKDTVERLTTVLLFDGTRPTRRIAPADFRTVDGASVLERMLNFL